MYKLTLNDTKINSKKSKYIIRMQYGSNPMNTYRVSKEIFLDIKNKVTPYRSMPPPVKKIKCIETGQTFKCAKDVMDWLFATGKTTNINSFAIVKTACNKKCKAYDYHFEFI